MSNRHSRNEAIIVASRVIGCPTTAAEQLIDALMDIMEEFNLIPLQAMADKRRECSNYRRTLAQINILLADFMKSEALNKRQLIDDARDLIHAALE